MGNFDWCDYITRWFRLLYLTEWSSWFFYLIYLLGRLFSRVWQWVLLLLLFNMAQEGSLYLWLDCCCWCCFLHSSSLWFTLIINRVLLGILVAGRWWPYITRDRITLIRVGIPQQFNTIIHQLNINLVVFDGWDNLWDHSLTHHQLLMNLDLPSLTQVKNLLLQRWPRNSRDFGVYQLQ